MAKEFLKPRMREYCPENRETEKEKDGRLKLWRERECMGEQFQEKESIEKLGRKRERNNDRQME